MSFVVPIEDISTDELDRIYKCLEFYTEPENTFKGKRRYEPKRIRAYIHKGDFIVLPFYWYYNLQFQKCHEFPNRHRCPAKLNIKFIGNIRHQQVKSLNEAQDLLRNYKTCILSLPCNFGKTTLALYLACKLGYLTCIIAANSKVLTLQWKDRITTFVHSPDTSIPSIHILSIKDTEIPKDTQFVITTVKTASAVSSYIFKDVGFLIVDEVDLIATPIFSKSLFRFRPKYLLGMSATPIRPDGMHSLLFTFFGDKMVHIDDTRYFEVYYIYTGFKMEIEKSPDGSLNWDCVLRSQATNDLRNKLISDILLYFSDLVCLVLCKRKEQCCILYNILTDLGISVSPLYGKYNKVAEDSRVIIATYSKAGIGMDNQKIGMVLFAGDCIRVEQYKGRARAEGSFPIIIDLIDDLYSLYKHWYKRKEWYEAHNSIVYSFVEKFPDFRSEDGVMESIARRASPRSGIYRKKGQPDIDLKNTNKRLTPIKKPKK